MTELTDLSETDASNILITSIDIDENCAPSGMNNAIRNTLGLIRRAFKSSIFRVRDATDQTKLLAFDLSGLPTATTTTLKVAVSQETYGQCRLAKDGANIRLSPYKGNLLTIDGYPQKVPSAGVALAATSLSAGVDYFIYAYMSAGTMTLEASTTGHSTDATTGVEIKTGDATRTLVGMARPITGPTWVDTVQQRLVVNWFNRTSRRTAGSLTTTVSSTSTIYFGINSAALKQEHLLWADESVTVALSGSLAHNTVTGTINTVALLGGSTILDCGGIYTIPIANTPFPISGGTVVQPGEGYAVFDLLGLVGTGTGSWLGSASAGPDRTAMTCVVNQ